MFSCASSFNQSLNSWNVSSVKVKEYMFEKSFDRKNALWYDFEKKNALWYDFD